MPNATEFETICFSGGAGPHLLIAAGVHGDEFEPMMAVRELIAWFRQSPPRGKVTLIPVVNPGAFQRAARVGADRLDLARVCPGRVDGSVTQRVGAQFAEFIRGADYFIDLHTGGRAYDVLPLVGYGLHPNREVLDAQRAMARAFNLPIVWGTDGRPDGRSLSVARDAGVPALYAEYRGGGGDPHAVRDYVAGCLNVAAHLGLIDCPPPASQLQYFVEDDRDLAGYLQIQHQAPCDGFFQPRVTLGQVVRQGETLGTICDALGEMLAEVPIAHDGIVLFLRVVPAVRHSDGLGGLLPITSPGELYIPRDVGQALPD